MPKTKKTEEASGSDSDSGPDDKVVEPPSKKSKDESANGKGVKSDEKSANESKSDSAEGPWTLEKLRMVSINEFRGRKLVDIREYYEKNGKTLPGKKGISLSITQWEKLLEVAKEITAAVKAE